jgi:hypothetical protein
MVDAWLGVPSFALQIYYDFSGYSDMAIGLAVVVGIHLPVNFNLPYKATSVIEFWRRWHITQSQFLRNYLYITLGGNRRGLTRRYVNLMITMLLGGLWHGASWTFVVWGAIHGSGLIVTMSGGMLPRLLARASNPGDAGLDHDLRVRSPRVGAVSRRHHLDHVAALVCNAGKERAAGRSQRVRVAA